MVTEGAGSDSGWREMTAGEIQAAARAGELTGAMTPGAPLGVVAPEGLPRAVRLIGREEPLERALARLADADAPVVLTISGPPGVGKTAFAAEIVARAGVGGLFPGGVVWLSCEELSGDAGLEATLTRVARSIGVEPEGKTSLEVWQAELRDTLRAGDGPRLLLALDSVEPALDWTALLDTLAGGRAALLLTARQTLQDGGTQDEPLAPLDLDSAAELFRQRLHQGDHARPTAEDEPLIAGAVAEAGGLPLAIGLAASLAAIMRQPLDQRPPAARADERPCGANAVLRARLDRSWATLPGTSRRLLAGLALVEGATFPRGVALAVAGAALRAPASDDIGVEDPGAGEEWREQAAIALDALIGLGLVEALAAGRLRLHPVIRRYAAARLREAPEDTRDALGAAMAGWWLDYARAHQGMDGVSALEAEAAGIMGAITWAHVRERPHTLLDLTLAAGYAWRLRGRTEDERHFLPWAVASARALDDPSRLRAALHDLAAFNARAAHVAEARSGFEEALRLASEQGDGEAAALARHALDMLPREP